MNTGPINTDGAALHFYHSDAANWDKTTADIVVEDSTITGAVRFEGPGQTLRRVTSAGSRLGFHSSLGTNLPGITLSACDLR